MMQDMAGGFNPFAPGFDFLKQLTEGKERLADSQFPKWTDWVAPTMNVQDLDKRISELKTIQFWLEQNQRALAATIQALEVQKMTLATLQTMNVPMENLTASVVQSWRDLASVAEGSASSSSPTAPAEKSTNPYNQAFTSPSPTEAAAPVETQAPSSPAPETSNASAADPMMWWSALTQQFQQIASQAIQDVTQRTMAQAVAAKQATAAASTEVMQKAGQVHAETTSRAAQPAARRAAAPKPRNAAPSPRSRASSPTATKRSTTASTKAKSTPTKPRTC